MRTLFILVGLLYFCGLSNGQECSPEILDNVDFLGTDIQFLQSPDIEHCQQLCTQHPSCHFFTFARSNSTNKNWNFYFYLKSTPTGLPRGQTPLQGVASGFSLKPCNIVSSRHTYILNNFSSYIVVRSEECQRACTHDPTCQFFTFINGNFTSAEYRYKCHLKFSWTVPRITRVQAKADLVSGFSQNIQTTEQSGTACETKFFPNTDIPGNNIESLPAASPEHCHALCTAHPQCTYFSYASDDFMCYLKNNPNEMVVMAQDRLTSGIPTRSSCQLDNTWVKLTHAGVDFWGSDFYNVLAEDADACQRTCTEDPNCQFYTYVTESFFEAALRRTCYLKRVITMPAPPQVTELANVVSGFSLKNCVQAPIVKVFTSFT